MDMNDIKKKELIKFLEKHDEQWFTLNQLVEILKIHNYKIELLMNQLLGEEKVIKDQRGKFTFWKIK